MQKKIIILFLISFTSLFLIHSDIKLEKVAVVNLDDVIKTVFSGKSGVLQDIKKDKDDLQSGLNKINDNIMKLRALRLKATDDSQKTDYDKKIDELEKNYADFYKINNYKIEKKLSTVKDSLLKEIYVQVKKIAENEGYSLVLDAKSDFIFYYSVDADITSKVIDYFNKNFGDKKDTH